MNLADILAALAEITDPDARTARMDELLSSSEVDLIALAEELSNRAAALTTIDPSDMTEEQIAEAEIIAQLIALTEERIDASEEAIDDADADADMESAATTAAAENVSGDETDDEDEDDTEQPQVTAQADTTADDTRTDRAKAASQALSQATAAKQAAAPATDAPATAPVEAVQTTPEQTAQVEPDLPVISTPTPAPTAQANIEKEAPEVSLEPVAAAGQPARRQSVPLTNVVPAPAAETSPTDPRRVKHTIIASGDLPGYRAGQELTDMSQVAAAVATGMSMVARSQAPGIQQQLANIRREAPDHLMYRSDGDYIKVDRVTEQKNLPGGDLVAAGGWCSPSEFLYDACPITVTDEGLVDLPTITASRGGIKYSGKPDFASVFSNVGFIQSEVDAIAGVQKPCFEIPCPADLSECRMDISGICLKQPILTEIGWPEKVEEFVEYTMLAHAHFMNAERIRRMVALATHSIEVPAPANPQDASIFDPHGPGAFESVLSILELQVEYFRYSGRLARGALLEALAPYWLRGILRADISKKLGIDDRWGAGADEALDRWFRDRGVSIQYVYDWQDALSEGDPTAFGGSVPTQWPTQVQILLYEPGTYFALQQDVITLSGVYDSVDLQRNVYTRLFTEEGFAVCSRCGRSMLITLNLCPNGLSGTQQRTQCSVVTP